MRLPARYHLSFANYCDPGRMGIGSLRVWNDDTIRPDTGFDLHGRRDIEIITYWRRGAIAHQDHLDNSGRTAAGDVQVISAGGAAFKCHYGAPRRRGGQSIASCYTAWTGAAADEMCAAAMKHGRLAKKCIRRPDLPGWRPPSCPTPSAPCGPTL